MANWLNSPNSNKRHNRLWIVAFVVAGLPAALLLSQLPSWAQPATDGRTNSTFSPGPGPGWDEYGGAMGLSNPTPRPLPIGETNDPAVKAQIEASQAVLRALSEFQGAKGDDAKAAAQKKLLEALTKCFDADMKVREAKLQKVEAQVKTLRSQFDKRASKKQEILELQLKLYENETEGLGFFGNPSAGVTLAPRNELVTPWPSTDRYDGPPPTFARGMGMAPPPANARPSQERSVIVPTPSLAVPAGTSPKPTEAE